MIYDPNYGDDKLCKCGHAYYRHFDTYDNMINVGCKYCGYYCTGFEAAEGLNPPPIVFSDSPVENIAWLTRHDAQFNNRFSLLQVTEEGCAHVFGHDVIIVLTPDGRWYLEEIRDDKTHRYVNDG